MDHLQLDDLMGSYRGQAAPAPTASALPGDNPVIDNLKFIFLADPVAESGHIIAAIS